jgi:AraC family transcriptional regulator
MQNTNGNHASPKPAAAPAVTVENLRVRLVSDAPGVAEYPGVARTAVALHVGAPCLIACRRDGDSHRGTAIHGDIDIIPEGTPSIWELKERDTALILSFAPQFLRRVAEESGLNPQQLRFRNRFQIRDPQIEHIGWTLQAEMERGYPHGSLYRESLATALAVALVHNYSSLSRPTGVIRGGFSGRTLKQVLEFIEDNLASDLSLSDIAQVAGLSISHCKVLFRQSLGVPVHQYVIRRRVERAAVLLRQKNQSISQIALETGFAHQSHLAMHMRRLLGVSPKELRYTLH